MNEVITRWQNGSPAERAALRNELAALPRERTEVELSRGFVVEDIDAHTLAGHWNGTTTFGPISFTELDDVADAFAHMDDPYVQGTRVKLWLAEGVEALRVGDVNDPSYSFEREWIVAGKFVCTATVEQCDAFEVVVVEMRPA